ncbi:MAG: NUDIX hydrolase [Alphaproteobacteria bacterium]|nr:NUDIX hydrolase [Alphaproteobacteria bacterium]
MFLLLWSCSVGAGTASCDPPGTQVEHPKAAGCVVIEEHALLMVRTRQGWTIPGGSIEEGESPDVAAVRESREEAGVDVRATAPACAVPGKRFVAWSCERTSTVGPAPDGDETTEARFLTREELVGMPEGDLRYPDQRDSLVRLVDAAG